MLKFMDVFGRWEAAALSQLEAAELLGLGERIAVGARSNTSSTTSSGKLLADIILVPYQRGLQAIEAQPRHHGAQTAARILDRRMSRCVPAQRHDLRHVTNAHAVGFLVVIAFADLRHRVGRGVRLCAAARRAADAHRRRADGISRHPAGDGTDGRIWCLADRPGDRTRHRLYAARCQCRTRRDTGVARVAVHRSGGGAWRQRKAGDRRAPAAPSLAAALLVQGTFVFAFSILTEAALSSLGAGVPPTHQGRSPRHRDTYRTRPG